MRQKRHRKGLNHKMRTADDVYDAFLGNTVAMTPAKRENIRFGMNWHTPVSRQEAVSL
jgi:hypothetical protein